MQRPILLIIVIILSVGLVPVRAQTLPGTSGTETAAGDHSIYLPQIYSEAARAERSAAQWETLEWQFSNDSYTGNPYDLIAGATFTHVESGEAITTGMFYVGGDTWAVRFTGTGRGRWELKTTSADKGSRRAAQRSYGRGRAGQQGFSLLPKAATGCSAGTQSLFAAIC
ncbi:MAG: DUF5060 domain-containing protein, partial [Oscillochloris sp.]|nr:DUF5060 domain-containing protein [Oscillochloris sp.]